jgi:hypothetical protein
MGHYFTLRRKSREIYNWMSLATPAARDADGTISKQIEHIFILLVNLINYCLSILIKIINECP